MFHFFKKVLSLSCLISFLFSLWFMPLSFSSNNRPIARAIKLRGDVSILAPHTLKGVTLKAGDLLQEDTSILTHKRSFVRILFLKDKSILNLGPSSKLILTSVKQNTPTLVNLLKGKLRAQIVKDKKGRHKFFVKTRVAALGVRGTDFATIYNPKNHITSLITFKGEVAMAKVKQTSNKKVSKNVDQTKVFEKILSNNKNVSLVKRGQYAGTMPALKHASKAVILNPIQLNILYKNNDFISKDKKKLKSGLLKPQAIVLKAAKQDVPAEGFSNSKTGDFAPKAGGVVDFTTGIYIAPSRDSVFDSKSKVFVDKESNNIDQQTGQYITPKGLVLDAKKGFIINKKIKLNAHEKKEVMLKANNLNTNINSKLLSQTARRIDLQPSYLSLRELNSKNIVSFAFRPGDISQQSKNNKYNSSSFSTFNFTWMQNVIKSFRPVFDLSISSVKYNNLFNIRKNNKSNLIDLLFALDQTFSNRFQVRYFMQFTEYPVISTRDFSQNTTTKDIAETVVSFLFPRIGVSAKYILYLKNRFHVNTNLGFFVQSKAQALGSKIDSAVGFKMQVDMTYNIRHNLFVRLGIYNNSFSSKLTNISFDGSTTQTDSLKFDQGGLVLDFNYIL